MIISGSAPNELVPVNSRLRLLFSTTTTKIIGDSNTSDSHCGNSEHMPYNLIFKSFPIIAHGQYKRIFDIKA
jgi:hypothetical protein